MLADCRLAVTNTSSSSKLEAACVAAMRVRAIGRVEETLVVGTSSSVVGDDQILRCAFYVFAKRIAITIENQYYSHRCLEGDTYFGFRIPTFLGVVVGSV